MTPDLDRAVEQFHAALDSSALYVAARDLDGELHDVGPEWLVEALLAAGWRPPEVTGVILFRRKYPGLRIVGWGPFPLPGEKRRMRRAQEYAEEVMRARKTLKGDQS